MFGSFQLISILILALVLFLVISSYFSVRKIIRSIRKLNEATKIIAHGDLAYRVKVKAHDDISKLGEALNDMAHNMQLAQGELQEYSSDLEKEVAEKTKDLLNKIDDLKRAKEIISKTAKESEENRQKIAKEKDKLDTILHSIGDGVFVLDTDLKVVIANSVAAKMVGYPVEEIIGKKYTEIFKFILENTGEVDNKFIEQAIGERKVQETGTHTVLVDKKNNQIPVSNSAAPLFNAGAQVIGCVIVFRDTTKEREIDKAKTEFVSLASHQLRTPLSSINWYTEMLLSGDAGALTDEQKKYLDEVYIGNQRMVDLVNALLNVSRLELGTFAVDPEIVDVVELAKSAINEQRPQLQIKKQKFNENVEENLPKLNADKKLLRMVFQNFLSNAIKYTPEEGTISFDLRLIKSDEVLGGRKIGEDSIGLAVVDSGYGIPEDQKDKIFTKLFRADNVREMDTEGTGLGLYIVKAIIEHSGGQTWFESELNKGTTFYMTLPLAGMKKKEGAKAIE